MLVLVVQRSAARALINFQYLDENRVAKGKLEWEIVREVSANSSFLRFILSLSCSASRRAAVILACICSPLISAILTDYVPLR